MSCAYAPSSPAEVVQHLNNVFSKSAKNPTNPQSISFSCQLIKSKISIRNPSGPIRTRPTAQIQAFYAPAAETLYELLGVTEKESLSDIKKAYKEMARKYHPDVSPPERVDEHTKRFIMVQLAYETLSDPQIRASYDRDLLAKGSNFAFASCHYNQSMEESRGEWRMRWNSQIDELKLRSSIMNSSDGTRRGRITWGARMRDQR